MFRFPYKRDEERDEEISYLQWEGGRMWDLECIHRLLSEIITVSYQGLYHSIRFKKKFSKIIVNAQKALSLLNLMETHEKRSENCFSSNSLYSTSQDSFRRHIFNILEISFNTLNSLRKKSIYRTSKNRWRFGTICDRATSVLVELVGLPKNKIIPKDFYCKHPTNVAKELLGKILVREFNNERIVGMITDVEAYGPPEEDPLVKTEGEKGLRNWQPGLAWTTYKIRGKPTLNITTQTPSCVLIRAIKLKEGDTPVKSVGPIKLAKALEIDEGLDKCDMTLEGPLYLCNGLKIPARLVVKTRRKNIPSELDTPEPRRFFIKCSCVS